MDNFAAKVYIFKNEPYQLYGDNSGSKLLAPADLVFSDPGGGLAGTIVRDLDNDGPIGTIDPYNLIFTPKPVIAISPAPGVDLSRIPSGLNNPPMPGGDYDELEVVFGSPALNIDSTITANFNLSTQTAPYPPQIGSQVSLPFYAANFPTPLAKHFHGARVFLKKNGMRVSLLGVLALSELDGGNNGFIFPAHLV